MKVWFLWVGRIAFVFFVLFAVSVGDILESSFFLGVGLMTESTLGLGQERKRWAVGLVCSAIVLMLGASAGYFLGWY